MKAAALFQGSKMPIYTETFPEPFVTNEDEILISVKAAAIKHLDKSKASGRHYSEKSNTNPAKVIGGDGVGVLADGTRVFALGVNGMIAERALVDKRRMVPLPDGIDDITAAALPNAVAGSAMALRFRAQMKPGDTVLIHGSTGFTGKIAVQIAMLYGAGKIIATGRNLQTLESLRALGADEIISITQTEEDFVSQLNEIHNITPIDVIIDYLWGQTAESILNALKGEGAFTHRTRFVSVGSLAGDKITLSSEILRSVDLQLSGSGLGSWTKQEMQILLKEIIPETYQMAVDKKLKVDTETISLKDIETAWNQEITGGKRLVAII